MARRPLGRRNTKFKEQKFVVLVSRKWEDCPQLRSPADSMAKVVRPIPGVGIGAHYDGNLLLAEARVWNGLKLPDAKLANHGGLYALIPLLGAEICRLLCEAAFLDQTDRRSGWFRIGEIGAFDLQRTG